MKCPLYYDTMQHLYYIIILEEDEHTIVGTFPLQFKGSECPVTVDIVSKCDMEHFKHHWNPTGDFEVSEDILAKVLLARE